ncbi:MAG TPA: hypothetical protein VK324_17300, partial [Tepidisphaeraceae bacterium]|nr:hypothetical protein [Tepidisphaeraceae bacterium]
SARAPTCGPVGDVMFPDPFVNGKTAEDRFFGFTDPGGILAIEISNTAGGLDSQRRAPHGNASRQRACP